MSATLTTPKTTSGGEIVRELVNASDGAGLHFDGSGVVAFTPVDLGSKFSHEFVLSTSEDLTTGTSSYIIDYHRSSGDPVTTDRFIIGFNPSTDSGNLAIYDNTGWESFGVNPLTDRKIHHLVVTVDGTSAKLYDNGNQVGTATISASHGIDGTTNAGLAGYYNNSNQFEGTIYRARSYNKALEPDEVQTAYERADVDFADQYGSQTELITSSSNRDFASGTGNWGANGITLVNDSGLLKIAQTNAYDPSNNLAAFTNGRLFLQKYQFSNPPNDKRYRLTLSAKATTSGSKLYFNLQSGSTTDISLNQVVTLTDSLATYSFDILPTLGNEPDYILLGLDTAETYWIDNVSLVRTGCVSDYDLAYASPTQSLTVQDRSGAADGTCSASGVTQVQPVVQLNSTSARIGTTQATPADGEIISSGKISSNGKAIIKSDGTVDWGNAADAGRLTWDTNDAKIRGVANKNLKLGANNTDYVTIDTSGKISQVSTNAGGDVTALTLRNGSSSTLSSASLRIINSTSAASGVTAGGSELSSVRVDSAGGGKLVIKTANSTDSSLEERLTIDSTGAATFTSNAISDQFVITNADETSTSAPDLVLYRNSASPAASDNLGLIQFRGKNDADESINYCSILGTVTDISDTSEDSKLTFYTYSGGTETPTLTLSSGVINIPSLSASSDVQTDGSKNLITSSDKRLKNDIGELTAGLDIISKLQPHYFSWKNDESNTQQLGFYAQDVYEFLPEAAPREEITNEDGSIDYKWGFNGRPIIAALVAAVKELKAKVETLENA